MSLNESVSFLSVTLMQWFLTFFAPWTPTVSIGTIGVPQTRIYMKEVLMDTELYFCDIHRPLTLTPRSPLVVPFGGPHLWFRTYALMGVENEYKSVK